MGEGWNQPIGFYFFCELEMPRVDVKFHVMIPKFRVPNSWKRWLESTLSLGLHLDLEWNKLVWEPGKQVPAVCQFFANTWQMESYYLFTIIWVMMWYWFIIRNLYLLIMPVSGTELLKPSEFLTVESYEDVFCHVNDWLSGQLLKLWARRTNHMTRGLELSAPSIPRSLGKGEGLEVESISNGQ